MDLAAFSNPVVFNAPHVGEVAVEARTVGFHLWVAKGMVPERWSSGAALMRDLLAEHARLEGGGPLAEAALVQLTPDDLELAAEAFLDAADSVMGPLAAGAGDAASIKSGESQTARLKRILFARAEAMTASISKLTGEITRPALQMRRAMDPVYDILKRQGELERLVQPSAILDAHSLASGSFAFQALQDAQRTIREAPWRSPLADLTTATSAITQIRESITRSINPIGIGSVYTQLRGLAALPKPLMLQSFLLGDHLAMTKLLRREFDLSLPSLAMASVTAFHAAEMTSVQRLAEAMLRPGFQATAIAGLEGLAARGAVADVLTRYGLETDPDAPVFGTVVEGVASLDIEQPADGDAQLQAIIDRLPELIAEAIRRNPGPITWTGLLNLVGVLLSTATLYLTYLGYEGDQAERRRPGTEAVLAKFDELKAARQADASGRRVTRYVHDRAWLRIKPNRDAPAIRAVYPDQPVRILEATDTWAKVEVYDYASERPTVGWISRRLLRVTALQ